jgi:hypothetical protein
VADRLIGLLSAAILAICLLLVVRAGISAPLHVPLNYNEGWNAYHAAELAAGRPLYPDPPIVFFTNYPPLSFYVIAPLGRLLGDQMLAGRIVALVALVAWIGFVGAAARRLGCSPAASLFGALMLAVCMFVFSSFYVGVNDPQILGHAVQAVGLVVVLGPRRSTASLSGAAALFVVGGFIKNNLVALPLAVGAWLLLTDRRSAWTFMAFGAAATIAGLAACAAAFGPQFAAQILSPRAYVPAKAALMGWQWVRRMVLPLAVAGYIAARSKGNQKITLAVTYLVVSIVLGVLFAGGEGVYWNAMFDADCALALTAALATSQAFAESSSATRFVVPLAYLAVPAAVVALSASIHWLSPRFWFDPRWSEASTAGAEIEFVRRSPGPALCDDLAFCYWAGKPVEVDFFNVHERATREAWRVETIARRIDAREFGVAQFNDPQHDLGPRFTTALRQNYRLDHTSQWGDFWVPREAVR